MYLSDNPIADFDRYDAACQREEERLPVCEICGEPIQDDYLYDLEGTIICEECLKSEYRKPVDNYVE